VTSPAKYVFDVRGVDDHGKVVLRKTLRRAAVTAFFANETRSFVFSSALVEMGIARRIMAHIELGRFLSRRELKTIQFAGGQSLRM